METRPNLYYPGNTVIAPHPGRKRKAKVVDVPGGYIPHEGRLFTVEQRNDKVCATSRCVWCGYRTDQYFITCPKCENCQYCGYRDLSDAYRCFICGNYLPDELQTKVAKIRPAPKNSVTIVE